VLVDDEPDEGGVDRNGPAGLLGDDFAEPMHQVDVPPLGMPADVEGLTRASAPHDRPDGIVGLCALLVPDGKRREPSFSELGWNHLPQIAC